MTYLNLVNEVLRRLREDTVTTVSQTTYSTMIGDIVNDAKTAVESAWDWSALRGAISFNTTADDATYSLSGTTDQLKVIDAINDTSNIFLHYQTPTWFTNNKYNTGTVTSSPANYTFIGLDGSGSTEIELWPIPDGVYALKFNIINRTGALSSDSNTTAIPHMPIVHLAYAYAARERGETGGRTAGELLSNAQLYLSDAIALDSAKNPEELIYRAV